MSAAVLSFRLCDRGLDCGGCLLDRALRNEAAAPPAPVAGPVPADLFYHPGHTWVRPLADGRLEVGVDDLARRVTGVPHEVRIPPAGTGVIADRPAFTVRSEAGEAVFVAPFSGVVSEVGADLARDPPLLATANYGAGFVYRAVPEDPARALTALLAGPQARNHLAREEIRLRELIEVAATAGPGSIALADGGRLDDRALAAVPRDRAAKILALLLGAHPA
jgi:glycine cleavage system H lipoate-binding protein